MGMVMDWLGNIVFKDRQIENERLELTDKECELHSRPQPDAEELHPCPEGGL